MRRILAVCFLISVFAVASQADPFTFVTPAGSNIGGQPVSASATVTTGAGTVTISLTNLLANPTDITQVITDFDFRLSNGATTGTLTQQAGTTINIAANGTFTPAGAAVTGWQLNSNTPAGFIQISALGGGQPVNGIIGPPNGSGVYSNANGSIAGNGPHNPFISQTGTFTINVTGVTSATQVTGAIFSFGTVAGLDVPGVPGTTPVPEPATLTSLAIGLLFIGIAGRIRRRTASATK